MKYLTPSTWNSLPIPDYRCRFFIESYMEKLSLYTPHFYQSRLMNVFSATCELLGYLKAYTENEKNSGYIIMAIVEIEDCFSKDIFAKKLFEEHNDIRQEIFTDAKSKIVPNTITKLRAIANYILKKWADYDSAIYEELRASIFDIDIDLAKKDRILKRINVATNLYLTNILTKKYSPTYLYNRATMFTYKNNYDDRSFQAQFDLVFDRLYTYKTQFDVYFSINHTRLDILDEPAISIHANAPAEINESNIEKLKNNFTQYSVIQVQLESTDYISAAWNAHEQLTKIIDVATAFKVNPRVDIGHNCVSVSKNEHLIHAKSLNIKVLTTYLTSENGTHFSELNTHLKDVFAKTTTLGRDSLERSLRYLRLARESISIEQKLLNLWISLESIFNFGNQTIIEKVSEFVPCFYSANGVSRRISYLHKLLSKNHIPIPVEIKEKFSISSETFDETISPDIIFRLVRDEDNMGKILYESLSSLDHLNFRLCTIKEEMQKNKNLRARLDASEQDVQRQIRRIYFLRNKISHTGHHSNINPQLITHLTDYLATCYFAIVESIKKAPTGVNLSIEELLTSYKLGVELVKAKIKSDNNPIKYDDIVPVPII